MSRKVRYCNGLCNNTPLLKLVRPRPISNCPFRVCVDTVATFCMRLGHELQHSSFRMLYGVGHTERTPFTRTLFLQYLTCPLSMLNLQASCLAGLYPSLASFHGVVWEASEKGDDCLHRLSRVHHAAANEIADRKTVIMRSSKSPSTPTNQVNRSDAWFPSERVGVDRPRGCACDALGTLNIRVDLCITISHWKRSKHAQVHSVNVYSTVLARS